MSLKQIKTLVSAPAAYPVTLAQVKTHLNITVSDHDTKLNQFIADATEYTEKVCSRKFISQTWDYFLDTFPASDNCPIVMPNAPLISVTTIKYYDIDSTLQTWSSANYTVDTDSDPGRIYPAYGNYWPVCRYYPKSVEIRFVCGYQESGDSPTDWAYNVPNGVKQAILMLIGHWFENREATIPGIGLNTIPVGYMETLSNYRVRSF